MKHPLTVAVKGKILKHILIERQKLNMTMLFAIISCLSQTQVVYHGKTVACFLAPTDIASVAVEPDLVVDCEPRQCFGFRLLETRCK